jgi:hypothetical protein
VDRDARAVGLAHLDPRALEQVAVEALDGALGALASGDGEQGVPFGLAGRAVDGDLDVADPADAGKEGDEVAFGGAGGEVLDDELNGDRGSPFAARAWIRCEAPGRAELRVPRALRASRRSRLPAPPTLRREEDERLPSNGTTGSG